MRATSSVWVKVPIPPGISLNRRAAHFTEHEPPDAVAGEPARMATRWAATDDALRRRAPAAPLRRLMTPRRPRCRAAREG